MKYLPKHRKSNWFLAEFHRIHQVRSYGRNIAVNIWWNYWKDNDVDVSTCEDNPKQDNNINTATFHGWADFESKEDGVL